MAQRLDLLIRKLNRMQDKSGSYKLRLSEDDERDIVKHLKDYEHFIEQRVDISGVLKQNASR